jgi:hypothetical protein
MLPYLTVLLVAEVVVAVAVTLVRSRNIAAFADKAVADLASGSCEIRFRRIEHTIDGHHRGVLLMMCLHEPVERFTRLSIMRRVRVVVEVEGEFPYRCTPYKMELSVRDADLAGVAYLTLRGKTPLWVVDPVWKHTFAVLVPESLQPGGSEKFITRIRVTLPTWPSKRKLELTIP